MEDTDLIPRADVLKFIADTREQFQREIDQGVLKHDLYQSVGALGGRDACDRIKRNIELRISFAEPQHLPSLLEQHHQAQQRPRRIKTMHAHPRRTA